MRGAGKSIAMQIAALAAASCMPVATAQEARGWEEAAPRLKRTLSPAQRLLARQRQRNRRTA